MSIHQLNIYGMDMVEVAIERLKAFEPKEGYYLAFSGGKDSVTVKALADMAGVKYDAHYTVTSVDPPELVRFVKSFTDVSFDFPVDNEGHVITMWNLTATVSKTGRQARTYITGGYRYRQSFKGGK